MKRILLFFMVFLFGTPAFADVCTETFTGSGNDDDPTTVTVEPNDLSCTGGGTVTGIVFQNAADDLVSSYCGNWYQFHLFVDGTEVAVGCASDLNGTTIASGFTTIVLQSEDLDNYSDAVTLTFDLEVTYTPPSCPAPTTLAATNITATTADLGWATGGATNWEIVVQADGTGAPSGSGTATSTNPYSATGLTAETAYEFYVRDFCNPDYSVWVGPFAFTTVCESVIAPWSEDFENAGSIPDCWNQGASNEEPWEFSNSGSGNHLGDDGIMGGSTTSGGYFAWVDDSTPNSSNTSLESPSIDVSGLTTPELSFFLISNNEGNANVDFSVDVFDGASWNIGFYTHNTNTFDGEWEEILVPLASLTITGDIQFRFVVTESATGSSDYTDDVAIDDVDVHEAPTCPKPTGLSASAETPNGATLEWVAGNSETIWDLYVIGTGGVAPDASSTPTNENVANPVVWSNGTAETTYDAYVRADCTGGDESDWIGPVTFTTLPTCPVPSGLSASAETPNGATLEWVAGNSETIWDLYVIGTGGAAPDASSTPTNENVANPVVWSNGTAETTYDAYVRADCTGGDESDWIGPVTFTTLCDVKTPDYTEDFASYVPNCWEEASNGDPTSGPTDFGSSSWIAEEFAHSSDSGLGAVNINLYSTGKSDWVLSPNFDLSAGGYELKLDVALTNYNSPSADNMGSDDEVQLLYTEDGTTWNNLMTWNASNQPATAGETITIALSSTGTNVRFGIWGYEGSVDDSEDYDFHFDNFVIQIPPAAPECVAAVSPAAANIYPDDVCSATDNLILEWAEASTGTEAVSYDVYFGETGSLALLETVNAPTTTSIVTVEATKTYVWKVVPKDANDNEPSAACPEWTFTVSDGNSGADGSGAGAGGYDFANDLATGVASTPTYGWIDPVAAGHTEITAWSSGSADDGYYTIPDIGFSFPFYGTNYQTNDVHVGTNGNIQFGATAQTSSYYGASIPLAVTNSTNGPNNWIAVMAMDLDYDGGGATDGKMYYGMSNGNFVVTWWHYHDFGQAEYITMQAILFNDGNGTFKLQYNDLESTNPMAAAFFDDGLIGMENADGTDGAVYRDGFGDGGPLFCSPRAVGFSTNASVLPITLADFSGKVLGNMNILNWTTDAERNASYFEVQRATSSSASFETLGKVTAAGNSNSRLDYNFTDASPSAMAYYRLKMVDLDGTFEYSDVITLVSKTKGFGLFGIYPIPTDAELNVAFSTEKASNMNLYLTDIAGRIMMTEQFESTTGVQKHQVDISGLAAGTYFVKLSDGQNILVQRVVKK